MIMKWWLPAPSEKYYGSYARPILSCRVHSNKGRSKENKIFSKCTSNQRLSVYKQTMYCLGSRLTRIWYAYEWVYYDVSLLFNKYPHELPSNASLLDGCSKNKRKGDLRLLNVGYKRRVFPASLIFPFYNWTVSKVRDFFFLSRDCDFNKERRK